MVSEPGVDGIDEGLRRRDLFRLNRLGMLLERTHAPSIYQAAPLRKVCESVVRDTTFEELDTTLLVNTVDLQRGSPVVWGLPGLRDVSVVDAVYASCALPGFYPPGDVAERSCVDGGVVDNLPVGVASQGMDAVIAVDTGSAALITQRDIANQGFTAIYMRAATTMMHALQLTPLEEWAGPPMILIRPRVSHIGWFSFTHTDELIDAGYRAAMEALVHLETCFNAETGVFPRRKMRLSVDREKCIGCTLCINACPVDCIVGASKAMHTVIDNLCTGCELCLPVCPVDCIQMQPVTPGRSGWQAWSPAQADEARERYAFHQLRNQRERAENDQRLASQAQQAVQAALQRSRARR